MTIDQQALDKSLRAIAEAVPKWNRMMAEDYDTSVRGVLWQTAPYPVALQGIVEKLTYKDWSINLDFYQREVGGEGLTLRIRFQAEDHATPGVTVFLIHDFEVPARVLDEPSWQRWVFDCIMLAERHESMELFKIDGQAVFFPEHKSTSDMYETKHVVHRRSIG